jgi:RNA 2',3'-cyclic 3'-phosphodiesterase
MKRLFIAIKINPDKAFLDQFHEIQRSLQHERIKWVEPQNIHITLKFLGDTREEVIPDIKRIVQEAAVSMKSFSFSLRNLGIFGSSYNPRVVWVGIEPVTELVSIMKVIHEKLEVVGFERDRQNLVPHLTIGRIKQLKDKKLFQQIIDQNKGISSKEIRADRFILYESILKKEGPEYTALQIFPLGS